MRCIGILAIATLGWFALASGTFAKDRDGLTCRKPDETAVLKNIEGSGDAVYFNYYPNELESEFSEEYLNCRTNAAISVRMNRDDWWKYKRARKIVKRAVASPVKYTRAQVIESLRREGLNAKPGKLNNTICACQPEILKKARRQKN